MGIIPRYVLQKEKHMETNRRKVKLSHKKLRKIIIIAVPVLAVLAGASIYLRARVTRKIATRGKIYVTTGLATAKEGNRLWA